MKNMHLFALALALLMACNPTTEKKQTGKTKASKETKATREQRSSSESEEWIQLFNGKDLEGWTIKINKHPLNENFNNTFRVENGLMITRYDQYEEFDEEYGHIFYKNPYSHYKLKVEYRVVGEQVKGGQGWALKNSGVMFHCQAPETMLVDQPFPVCLEAQFLGGTGEGDRPTGNLCTPSTHVIIDGELVEQHCISSTSNTYHGEEWIHFELVVYGDSLIYHIVEGDTVLTYSKPRIGGDVPEGFPLAQGTPLTSGYIALQAESHPYEFRKVELLEIFH